MRQESDKDKPLISENLEIIKSNLETPLSHPFKLSYYNSKAIIRFYDEPSTNVCQQVISISLASLFSLIKVMASMGQRIYSIIYLFDDTKSLLYRPVISHIPNLIKYLFVTYSSAADAHLMVYTRVPATINMMARCHEWNCCCCVTEDNTDKLDHTDLPVDMSVFNSPKRKVLRYILMVFGGVTAVTSSLSTLLGVVTFLKYFGVDSGVALRSVGVISALSNFVSNLAYRVKKKADRNLSRLFKKELRFPKLSEVFIILLATGATICQFYFGTFESIKLSLDLFDIDLSDSLSSKITLATLPPSIIVYLFSQCAELLIARKTSGLANNEHKLIDYLGDTYNEDSQNRRVCIQTAGLKLLGYLGYALIAGEMLGNATLVLNGMMSLTSNLTDNIWLVGITAALMMLVNAKIYWQFNIVDWVANIRLSLIYPRVKNQIHLLTQQSRVNHTVPVLELSTQTGSNFFSSPSDHVAIPVDMNDDILDTTIHANGHGSSSLSCAIL